jgi:hypothetical protein
LESITIQYVATRVAIRVAVQCGGRNMGKDVHQGRWTARSDEGIVVFLIGMRINTLRAVRQWFPAFTAMGRMLRELSKDRDRGLLGFRTVVGGPRQITVIQYWSSTEELLRYAHDGTHRSAWKEFYRRSRGNTAVGIWHETYAAKPGEFEAFYANMPPNGLAAARGMVPVGRRTDSAAARLAAGQRTG